MSDTRKPSDYTPRATVTHQGTYWRVVSVRDDSVTFSGPGPCRSLKTVPDDELHEWVPVAPA